MLLLLLSDKKSGKENKHSKFCPIFTGQGREVSLAKILFPQLRKASLNAIKEKVLLLTLQSKNKSNFHWRGIKEACDHFFSF